MAKERNEYEGDAPWSVLDRVLGKLRVLEFALIGMSSGGFDHEQEDIDDIASYLIDIHYSAKKYLDAWLIEYERKCEQEKSNGGNQAS